MRSFAVVFASTLFPFSLLTLATQSALAQEPEADEAAAAPAPPAGAPPGAVLVPVEDARPNPKQFAITLNPIGMFIGRYSITAEYLPVVHHGISLTPFYNHTPVKVTDPSNGQELDAGSLNGGGAELGYKYYTGNKGPNGFYVGPSFLFGSYSASQSGFANDSFTSIGGAVDFGGQAVVGPGIVVGGGFGIQWTKTSHDINTDQLNFASALIAGGGTRPRALFSIGYAF